MAARGKVIDLGKRRIERLAVDLAREPHNGHVIVDVEKIDSVDVWHAAARVAALGRPSCDIGPG